jgi:DNA uptake protein ComE-like DNA-binding protein
LGRLLRKSAEKTSFPAVRGRFCVFIVAKGRRAWTAGRVNDCDFDEGGSMLRRSFLGILALAALQTITVGAQVKESPKAPARQTVRIIDINSAPETDIAAVGIEKTVAKKIVEGRPYRNKRDLVTRQLLSEAEYEKVKNAIVARQPPKK